MERIKTKDTKMKKENSFWKEHEATIKPLLFGLIAVAICVGIYFGAEAYNKKKYQQKTQQPVNTIKQAIVDTVAFNKNKQR